MSVAQRLEKILIILFLLQKLIDYHPLLFVAVATWDSSAEI